MHQIYLVKHSELRVKTLGNVCFAVNGIKLAENIGVYAEDC